MIRLLARILDFHRGRLLRLRLVQSKALLLTESQRQFGSVGRTNKWTDCVYIGLAQ